MEGLCTYEAVKIRKNLFQKNLVISVWNIIILNAYLSVVRCEGHSYSLLIALLLRVGLLLGGTF